MRRSMLLLAALSLPLGGCYSMAGPPQVVNATGILPPPHSGGALESNFASAARLALAAGATETDFERFMRTGFTLTYARCSNYFTNAGRNQGRSRLLRDAVGPIVSLLTGIITLHDFGDDSDREQRLLEILTLGSVTGTAALDTFDRNFLFGSDNIDSVRQMTFNALSTHSGAALARKNNSFEQAVVHLIDNQLMCSPPHILSLARQAISRSNMEARGADGKPDDRSANTELERVDVRPE